MLLRIVMPTGKWGQPKFAMINGVRALMLEVEPDFALHQGVKGDKPILLDVRAIPDPKWDVVTIEVPVGETDAK